MLCTFLDENNSLKAMDCKKNCVVTDVDIYDIIEDFVDNCFYRSSSRTARFIHNCVSGR